MNEVTGHNPPGQNPPLSGKAGQIPQNHTSPTWKLNFRIGGPLSCNRKQYRTLCSNSTGGYVLEVLSGFSTDNGGSDPGGYVRGFISANRWMMASFKQRTNERHEQYNVNWTPACMCLEEDLQKQEDLSVWPRSQRYTEGICESQTVTTATHQEEEPKLELQGNGRKFGWGQEFGSWKYWRTSIGGAGAGLSDVWVVVDEVVSELRG